MYNVLLLTKSSHWCHLAQIVMIRWAKDSGAELVIVQGEPDDALPDVVRAWTGDLIVSYLCPWVLPKSVLDKSKRAINFHPAPPEHPGFAPYSFAIYNRAHMYGVTVHHMEPRVDSGAIFMTRDFPSYPDDTPYTLQQRAMRHLFAALMETIDDDFANRPAYIRWFSKPRTRADFEKLRVLTPSMPDYEIKQRIRACSYPGRAGAYFPEDVQ